MNDIVISAVKFAMPHGIVSRLTRSKARRLRMMAQHAARSAPAEDVETYSYGRAIDFHCRRGLQEGHVISGSMPEASLAFCSSALDGLLSANGPIIGLHVGNFLGVSLSHFTNYGRGRNDRSVVVSVDPDLTHRGIEHPQQHVIAILNHFGLQRNAIISVGYSMDKSLSNDGVEFSGESGEYDPYTKFATEQACEATLSNLALTSPGRFDFAVIDGNHDAAYLRRETAIMRELLRPGGVLILDDVSDAWADIKAEYAAMESAAWRTVGADGRVGVLQAA